MLILATALCSCAGEKDIFSSKFDYVNYGGERYIQSRMSVAKHSQSDFNVISIPIVNRNADTIYIFSTVLDNPDMFYSGKNIRSRKSHLIVDSYYDGYMKDAAHSGIRKFNFFQVLPGDSMVVSFDIDRLERMVNPLPPKIELRYYYFEKKGRNFDGLVNVEKGRLHCGSRHVYILKRPLVR
nr:hypothetical protein [uncultured Chitinophaga sp.]